VCVGGIGCSPGYRGCLLSRSTAAPSNSNLKQKLLSHSDSIWLVTWNHLHRADHCHLAHHGLHTHCPICFNLSIQAPAPTSLPCANPLLSALCNTPTVKKAHIQIFHLFLSAARWAKLLVRQQPSTSPINPILLKRPRATREG
jgi:hypothetical protein